MQEFSRDIFAFPPSLALPLRSLSEGLCFQMNSELSAGITGTITQVFTDAQTEPQGIAVNYPAQWLYPSID